LQSFERGARNGNIPNVLLCAGFSHTTCDDIGDDVAGLNDSKQQLTDFT
jgi:hypothetical protein